MRPRCRVLRLNLPGINVLAGHLQAAILIQRDTDTAVPPEVGGWHLPHAGMEGLCAVKASAMLHQPHLVGFQDMDDSEKVPCGFDGSFLVLSHIPHQARDYDREQ